jgi:plastocyanin
MRSGTLSIIIILMLIALGGWYYYGAMRVTQTARTDNLVGTSSVATTTETLLPTEAATSTAPEDDVTVTGYNFGFSPSTLIATKGDHVKVEFGDQGGVHDFVIDELGARSPRIDTGATTSIEFDVPLSGTFTYYSSAGNDRANGMWGSLTVMQ